MLHSKQKVAWKGSPTANYPKYDHRKDIQVPDFLEDSPSNRAILKQSRLGGGSVVNNRHREPGVGRIAAEPSQDHQNSSNSIMDNDTNYELLNNYTPACSDINQILRMTRNDWTTLDHIRVMVIIAYAAIFVVGMGGNSCVIYSIYRHRSLRTVRNVFILGLSTSDILSAFFSVLFTPIIALIKEWKFGRVMCHIIPLLQGSSLCFSTFTLTCIAVDRYILIVHPTKNPLKRLHAITMLLTGVSIAVTISSFAAAHHEIVDYTGHGICGQFCMENWDTGLGANVRKAYGLSLPFLSFFLPLIVISFCYSMIIVILHLRNTRRNGKLLNRVNNGCADGGGGGGSRVKTERELIQMKRQRRTNMMLILMVVIFAFCWSLFVLMNFLRDLESLPKFVGDQEGFYQLVAHCIAVSSTVWNPILYGMLNEQFRAAFKEIFGYMFCCCSRTADQYRQYRTRLSTGGGGSHHQTGVGGRRAVKQPPQPPHSGRGKASAIPEPTALYGAGETVSTFYSSPQSVAAIQKQSSQPVVFSAAYDNKRRSGAAETTTENNNDTNQTTLTFRFPVSPETVRQTPENPRKTIQAANSNNDINSSSSRQQTPNPNIHLMDEDRDSPADSLSLLSSTSTSNHDQRVKLTSMDSRALLHTAAPSTSINPKRTAAALIETSNHGVNEPSESAASEVDCKMHPQPKKRTNKARRRMKIGWPMILFHRKTSPHNNNADHRAEQHQPYSFEQKRKKRRSLGVLDLGSRNDLTITSIRTNDSQQMNNIHDNADNHQPPSNLQSPSDENIEIMC